MAGALAAAYVPSGDLVSGHMLFIREQILFAQRFHVKKLELVGEPIPIADPVSSLVNYGLFSASSNGILIFKGISGSLSQFTRFDRQGKILGREGANGTFAGISIFSDRRRAAVSLASSPAISINLDIWLIDFFATPICASRLVEAGA